MNTYFNKKYSGSNKDPPDFRCTMNRSIYVPDLEWEIGFEWWLVEHYSSYHVKRPNGWSLFSRWENLSTRKGRKSGRTCYLAWSSLPTETSHVWERWISFVVIWGESARGRKDPPCFQVGLCQRYNAEAAYGRINQCFLWAIMSCVAPGNGSEM